MSKSNSVTNPMAVAVLVLTALIASSVGATTLEDVRKKGLVRCGVSTEALGFSSLDNYGKWVGLNVDLCRAVAAVVLGYMEKVEYTQVASITRFFELGFGKMDILLDGSTWTLERDTVLGLNFAGVNFYDGQGFLVRKDLGLKSAKELGGAIICVATGTTSEWNLAGFFRKNQLTYEAKKFGSNTAAAAAYDAGKCDAFTTDRSSLAGRRLRMRNPDDHVVLPDVISKEPLGPVVRHGDEQWLDLVRWTLFAMFEAEEIGVTSKNVDQMKESKNPAVRRLLGLEGNMGKNLGVDNGWAYRIIKQVGNYQESYERHIGLKTPLKLPRGINALWKHGGLHYPMPVR